MSRLYWDVFGSASSDLLTTLCFHLDWQQLQQLNVDREELRMVVGDAGRYGREIVTKAEVFQPI
jgi:hypothetical protein